ncbi:MAG: YciI family protein [Thermomicrobiales bacterium]|nr:YciI family protein [Thermomicrobiales bacterium]
MAKFVVFTTFTSQDLRARHRPEHRVHLRKLVDEGALLLAGPFEDETSGGMMIFEAESAEAVSAMVNADPFTTEGVFASIEIRPFTQVVP